MDAVDLVAKSEDSDEPVDPVPTRFDNKNAPFLGTHLRALARQADLSRAEFFEAIARFDELQGWRVNGSRDCVRWMMSELGFSRSLAYQELKAARDLRTLPVIAGLFASGKFTWCKVKALLRVATPEDERALAITALDLDADAVQRLCDDYRFGNDPGSDAERDRAQQERRSLTYTPCADGSIAIHIVLPPEAGADVIPETTGHRFGVFSIARNCFSVRQSRVMVTNRNCSRLRHSVVRTRW